MRNEATNHCHLLIYVANWPRPRAHDWRTLLAARAIENQCYVAAVNRVGEDGTGLSYQGDSCVIDLGPRGVIVRLVEVNRTVTVAIEREKVVELRAMLPFWAIGTKLICWKFSNHVVFTAVGTLNRSIG